MISNIDLHKWFVAHEIDPLFGWEVIETAHDESYPLINFEMLVVTCHTYIMAMIEMVIDEPTSQNLDFFLRYLVPLMRSMAKEFDPDQWDDIVDTSEHGNTPMIESAVRVILAVHA